MARMFVHPDMRHLGKFESTLTHLSSSPNQSNLLHPPKACRRMKQLLIVNIALPFYLFVDHHKTGQPKTIDAFGKGIERNAHTGVTFARFQGHILSYLNITALGVDYVHSSVDCGLACISTPSCFSFNLAAVIEMNSKILCELLPSDIFNNSDKLVANHLFHHFSIWVRILSLIHFKRIEDVFLKIMPSVGGLCRIFSVL